MAQVNESKLEMRRVFLAPRERVFRAWVEPEALGQWFHPGPAMSSRAEVDLQVGGRYLIEMENVNGTRFRVGGTYREVVEPERLVFTWQWEAEEPTAEMLVTVEFFAIGEGITELVLTHIAFPSLEERNSHAIGWEGTLNQLVARLQEEAETVSE